MDTDAVVIDGAHRVVCPSDRQSVNESGSEPEGTLSKVIESLAVPRDYCRFLQRRIIHPRIRYVVFFLRLGICDSIMRKYSLSQTMEHNFNYLFSLS